MAFVELDLSPDLESIAELADAVDTFSEDQNLSDKVRFQLNLVLEELVTNIVSHADFGDNAGRIQILISLDANVLQVCVSDNGAPFDPVTEPPEPDLDSTLEERRVGGLGIHLVKSFTQQVSYHRHGEKNETRFVKHIGAS